MILQDIAEELQLLLTAIEEVSDDEAKEILKSAISVKSEDLNTKIEGYCWAIKELEASSKARKEEADRLSSLSKYDENQAKRLKGLLQWVMDEMLKCKSIKTRSFNVTAQNAGGKQSIEYIIEHEEVSSKDYLSITEEVASQLSDRYVDVKTTYAINTSYVREDLEDMQKRIDGLDKDNPEYSKLVNEIEEEYSEVLTIARLKNRNRIAVIR